VNLDNAVVFFTSDHGDYGGHRGLMRKKPWVPFDDLARVPFFVSGGGITGGRRVPQLVQSCDFALTCLDYAGVAPPVDVPFETRSLRPVLDGHPGPDDLDRHVCSGITVEWPMIRHGRYKFIRHGVQSQQAVLFDLEADPLERVNLFRDPAYADVRDALAARLQETMLQPVLDVPAPAVAAPPSN
jgi:arylsulfatase